MTSDRRRILLVTLASGVACTMALVAAAEETTWDQAKVTELAQAFSKDIQAVKLAYRREPGEMIATGDRRSRYELKQSIRLLDSEARHLAKQLADGKGRDETYPVFRRLEEIRREAGVHARRTMLTQPTLEKIAAARSHLEGLAPYYGAELGPAPVALPAD